MPKKQVLSAHSDKKSEYFEVKCDIYGVRRFTSLVTSMDMMQGLWWILGACGVVLVIVMFRKNTEILVNFLLRMVMGVIGIYFVNQFLAAQNIAIAVGLNPASLLTVGGLGIPGFALLYGIMAVQIL